MKINVRFAALILIGINILVFILQNTLPASFTDSLVLVTSDALTRPWTLITSMFLHANFMHILFNMYVLYMFGLLVEQKIGTKRFVFIYFLSGLIASIGFALIQELLIGQTVSGLGASGAVMGILGVTMLVLPDLKVLFFFFVPMSIRVAGVIIAAIDLLGLLGIGLPGIANAAHLAGLITGLIYGFYLVKKRKDFKKRFATRSYKQAGPRNINRDTIELSDDEIEDYLKHGRL